MHDLIKCGARAESFGDHSLSSSSLPIFLLDHLCNRPQSSTYPQYRARVSDRLPLLWRKESLLCESTARYFREQHSLPGFTSRSWLAHELLGLWSRLIYCTSIAINSSISVRSVCMPLLTTRRCSNPWSSLEAELLQHACRLDFAMDITLSQDL
jgi:hypothetical protein